MFTNTKIIVEIKSVMQKKNNQMLSIGWFVEFENGEAIEYLINMKQSVDLPLRSIMYILLKHYPRERIEKVIRAWSSHADGSEYFDFAFANETSWKENCEMLFDAGFKPPITFVPTANNHIDYYLTKIGGKEYETIIRLLKDTRAKDAKIAELTSELANLRVQVNKIVSDTPIVN